MADLVLSKEDEELYDRQIRVWGVDACMAAGAPLGSGACTPPTGY